jgi:hypothetical protein
MNRLKRFAYPREVVSTRLVYPTDTDLRQMLGSSKQLLPTRKIHCIVVCPPPILGRARNLPSYTLSTGLIAVIVSHINHDTTVSRSDLSRLRHTHQALNQVPYAHTLISQRMQSLTLFRRSSTLVERLQYFVVLGPRQRI